MAVSEERILEIVKLPRPKVFASFDLSELLNDSLVGFRRIDLQAGKEEHTNPGRYLQVVDMASGRAIAWWEEGMHDYSVFHAYLIGKDGTSARYTTDLFHPDSRER